MSRTDSNWLKLLVSKANSAFFKENQPTMARGIKPTIKNRLINLGLILTLFKLGMVNSFDNNEKSISINKYALEYSRQYQ